jgi:hypothetical protein
MRWYPPVIANQTIGLGRRGSRAPVTNSTALATPTATTKPSTSPSVNESDPVASDNIATAITAMRHVNTGPT